MEKNPSPRRGYPLRDRALRPSRHIPARKNLSSEEGTMLRDFESPSYVRGVMLLAVAVVFLGFAIVFGRYQGSPALTEYVSGLLN